MWGEKTLWLIGSLWVAGSMQIRSGSSIYSAATSEDTGSAEEMREVLNTHAGAGTTQMVMQTTWCYLLPLFLLETERVRSVFV